MAKLTKEELEILQEAFDTVKANPQIVTTDTLSGFGITQGKINDQIYKMQLDLAKRFKEDQTRQFEEQLKHLEKRKREIELRAKLGKARDTEAGKVLYDFPEDDKILGLEALLKEK